jgi:hypothetical protein
MAFDATAKQYVFNTVEEAKASKDYDPEGQQKIYSVQGGDVTKIVLASSQETAIGKFAVDQLGVSAVLAERKKLDTETRTRRGFEKLLKGMTPEHRAAFLATLGLTPAQVAEAESQSEEETPPAPNPPAAVPQPAPKPPVKGGKPTPKK